MAHKPDESILEFEKDFIELMKIELFGNISLPTISYPFASRMLFDFYFDAGEVLKNGNNAFYFFEIICHPYKHDVDLEADDWCEKLLNYTLKKVAVEKVENTLTLSLIRVFYILWYGIQTKNLDEELLMSHFVDIWGFLDNEILPPIVPYSFLKKYYPAFDDDDIENGLRLALQVEHPNIADKIFEC